MSDTVTILASTLPLTKTIYPDRVEPYGKAKHFSAEEVEIKDLKALSQLLLELESDPHCCIVRGKIKPGTDLSHMVRKSRGPEATLVEVPRHWVMLDFDGILEGQDDGDQSEQLVSGLPEIFHGAAHHWQYSSSTGLGDTWGAHYWYWLERPLNGKELKVLLKGVPFLDMSPFSPAQPHYTAAPILAEGAEDPLSDCDRSWYIPGGSEVPNKPAVDLNDPKLLATPQCPQDTPPAEHALELARTLPPAVEGEEGSVTLLRFMRAVAWGLDLEEADAAIQIYNARCVPPWEPAELEHKWATARAEDGAPKPRGWLLPTDLQSPKILQQNGMCWFRLDDESYSPGVPAIDFGTAAREHFNDVEELTDRMIRLRAGTVLLYEVSYSYMHRKNTYDPELRELHIATLTWPDILPKEHPDIDRWLRAFGGEPLLDWLSCLTQLDMPCPMLVLCGDLKVGKDLLVEGIAKLFGSAGDMAECVGTHNPALLKTPIAWANEELPPDITFARLRKEITNHNRRCNPKHKGQLTVKGCGRFIYTCNSVNDLRYQRSGVLTPADVSAVADRLLYIDSKPRTQEIRQALEGLDLNVWAQQLISEHVLWLCETRDTSGQDQRMAMAPNGLELVGIMVDGKLSPGLDELEDLLAAPINYEWRGDVLWVRKGVEWRALFDLLGVSAKMDVRQMGSAKKRMWPLTLTRRSALQDLRPNLEFPAKLEKPHKLHTVSQGRL